MTAVMLDGSRTDLARMPTSLPSPKVPSPPLQESMNVLVRTVAGLIAWSKPTSMRVGAWPALPGDGVIEMIRGALAAGAGGSSPPPPHPPPKKAPTRRSASLPDGAMLEILSRN